MNINKLKNKFFNQMKFDEKLSSFTWFGVGGDAEILFTPDNIDGVINFIKDKPKNLRAFIIGAGSNILIRDNGIKGISLLTKNLNNITMDEKGVITAESGANDIQVARFARENERTDLEFLVGIPGTVGGGIRMNSGAFGSEFKDVLIDVNAINQSGELKTFTSEELGMKYRHIDLSSDWIFNSARFKTSVGNKKDIQSKMKEIIRLRGKSQPIGVKTGGSTFMNTSKYKAWELIDKAGCRGLKFGDAMISEKHCNFIINTKKSSAQEIESLGELVKEKVMASSGIDMNWEIQKVGLK
ncbi:UDP-N-acetylmuramate dehydrogenase [Alphaproteobacteria bacterium]|nr:UDP-N-acetylmuramate dehydrogenase [Alphaproteobacteria bacterium]